MIEVNKIYQGDCLEVLKTFPNESINCIMTSPPYWALRDYGTAKWIGGNPECKHEVKNNIKDFNGDWDRPSRKEFNKIGTLLKCQVCGVEFNGKIGNKFCSIKCLNTLSNEERTKAQSEMINTCSICGAKRIDNQLGLEPTFQEYISKLCDIFDEVKRVLRKDGTCWVNIGDTYYGGGRGSDAKLRGSQKGEPTYESNKSAKPNWNLMDMQSKSLCNIPARFSIEMQNRGWILRNVIIWHKPNCMPCSVKDRFTVDFEYLFFFVKNKKYWFETQFEPIKEVSKERMGRKWCGSKKSKHGNPDNLQQDIKAEEHMDSKRWTLEQGRNMRCVWDITLRGFPEAHFATYPEELCEIPIKAGCPEGGIVLDMFFGAGTTGLVALKQNKKFIGIELNPKYIKIAKERLKPYLEQRRLIYERNNI